MKAPFFLGWLGWDVDMVLFISYHSTMNTGKKETTINTRYPADVYEAIKQFAQEDSRSFNNMVIWILRQYIQTRKGRQSKS
jgi:hypothetical protein